MTDHDRPVHGDAADARSGHERFADWDAAYVLGSLSPADRRAYEEHLAECPVCSTAVRELAGMPGLLGALPRDEAMSLLDGDTAGHESRRDAPDLVPALLHRVRRRRRVRRWSVTGALVAAAAVTAVTALILPGAVTAPPEASVSTSLHQVGLSPAASPLTADVTLTAKRWGTSIGMVCRWQADSSWSPDAGGTTRWEYGLWVVAGDGTSDRVATWSAGPGDVVRTTDSTAIPVGRIARIELRSLDTGKVLLSARVHGPSPAAS